MFTWGGAPGDWSSILASLVKPVPNLVWFRKTNHIKQNKSAYYEEVQK